MGHSTRRLMQGAAGAAGGATYVDDVFSTYLYEGNETSRSINNGVDNTEGGMVWIKNRDNSSFPPYVYDTVRGVNKQLRTSSNANETTSSNTLTAFNNNGFSMGTDTMINRNNDSHVAWNFRKAPGFCDVVTFTSTGAANQRIPHSLGCEPGMIICKSLTGTSYWVVYHRAIATLNPSDPWSKSLLLDENYAASTLASDTWGTGPTSTDFGFKAGGFAATGTDWVAYVFAGGESTAATARSVAFSSGTGGSSNSNAKSLTIANSSDTDFGSGDFTMECWFKDTRTSDWSDLDTIFSMSEYTTQSSNVSFSIYYAQGGFVMFNRTGGGFDMVVDSRDPVYHYSEVGQWHHFAWTRSGSGTNNNKLWIDGTLHAQFTRNVIYTNGQDFYIGGNNYSGTGSPNEYGFNGNISNVRITKGQAIYTNSFKPSNEPLTTTTGGATASNVKVICCNNSSITGSTLTSGTISSTNTPTASTDSPFDDIEGYKFGRDEDQNIIKTGSYVGNGNANGPDVYVGWEPQWVLTKNADISDEWYIYDSMRGIVSDGYDPRLRPNSSGAEASGDDRIDVTPTGFKIKDNNGDMNGNGNTIIYMAIRRPDGYVGKPTKAGTDVLTMTPGTSGAPLFLSQNHIVDFTLQKSSYQSGTADWTAVSRLTQGFRLETNTPNAEVANSNQVGDYQNGWSSYTGGDGSRFAWLFKRSAGLDVVTYTGTGTTHQIPHSLNKTVEMFWLKSRGSSANWMVYHKGLNGGTNPEQYYIRLNLTNPEVQASSFGDTAPTSTHFTVGSSSNAINSSGDPCIALLFASVTGISKVGYYTGNGSSQTITTGFSPRFVIIRRTDGSEDHWLVLDTTRGWVSGNDKGLKLNSDSAQGTSEDYGAPTSTGFSLTSNGWVNYNTGNYIYYAHA